MSARAAALTAIVAWAAGACAPAGPRVSGGPDAGGAASPVEGAWRLVAAETLLPDGSARAGSPRESLVLFSSGFYSMGWASSAEPTPYYETRFRPTDEERLARYGELVVNAGRYEVSGSELTIHPTFALVPEYVGGLGVFDWELRDGGDVLQLVWKAIESEDGVRDPATAAGFRWRYTLRRMR